MKRDGLDTFFLSRLPSLCAGPPRNDTGYALPDASLACLKEIITQKGIAEVFEFGTGRSTKLFLEAGCKVTSLEDSGRWLDETRRTIAPEKLGHWNAICAPLQKVWHHGAPFLSWQLTPELKFRLAEADLVLIDSPALPPFREHALLLALRHARCALIVVDDANIPTVRRFCTRLAKQNSTLMFHASLDHGLFFVGSRDSSLYESRGFLETLKIWRIFLIRKRAWQ